MKILQPKAWPRPKGYSNGIEASGKVISVSGQIGWDENQKIVSEKISEQVRQALKNIQSILAEGNAGIEKIVRMTWYVTNLDEYRSSQKEVGEAYREIMGDHYPAMSLIQVAGLLEPGAKVEIEATAVG